MMSLSFMMRRSLPSILTSVPDHLPKKNAITGFDVESYELVVVATGTWATSYDFTFLRLFSSSIWDDDAACGLCLAVDALNDHAVVQRTKLHEVLLLGGLV